LKYLQADRRQQGAVVALDTRFNGDKYALHGYPAQSALVGAKVAAVLTGVPSGSLVGTIVRDDTEGKFRRTILLLGANRYFMSLGGVYQEFEYVVADAAARLATHRDLAAVVRYLPRQDWRYADQPVHLVSAESDINQLHGTYVRMDKHPHPASGISNTQIIRTIEPTPRYYAPNELVDILQCPPDCEYRARR